MENKMLLESAIVEIRGAIDNLKATLAIPSSESPRKYLVDSAMKKLYAARKIVDVAKKMSAISEPIALELSLAINNAYLRCVDLSVHRLGNEFVEEVMATLEEAIANVTEVLKVA